MMPICLLTVLLTRSMGCIWKRIFSGCGHKTGQVIVATTFEPAYNPANCNEQEIRYCLSWWCYQMETFSTIVAFCEGIPPVTGGFPKRRPMTRIFHVFFDICLNKPSGKPSRIRWFETPWRSLWRHCNVLIFTFVYMSENMRIKHRQKIWKQNFKDVLNASGAQWVLNQW